MKRITIVMAAALALSVGTAHAATPPSQQMKVCTAEATKRGLEGEDRRAFMSECLAGKSTGIDLPPQPDKTKSCDAEATGQGLQGAARQKFLSDCLAKEPAAEPTAPAAMPEKPGPAVPAPVPTPGTAPLEPNR